MADTYTNNQIMELVKEQASSIRKLTDAMVRVETNIEYIKQDIGEIKNCQKLVDERLQLVEAKQNSNKFFDNLGQSIVQYIIMAIIIAILILIGVNK